MTLLFQGAHCVAARGVLDLETPTYPASVAKRYKGPGLGTGLSSKETRGRERGRVADRRPKGLTISLSLSVAARIWKKRRMQQQYYTRPLLGRVLHPAKDLSPCTGAKNTHSQKGVYLVELLDWAVGQCPSRSRSTWVRRCNLEWTASRWIEGDRVV